MNILYLKNERHPFFKKAWQLYQDSFPTEEKRTLDEQVKILSKSNYKMLCYTKDEVLISIVFYWKISRYTFLEHFAVSSELRGQSYGSKVLKRFIEENENIVLEIDPIIDTLSNRRFEFYKRFDFVLNNHEHYQIPFREGESKLKLLLMTQNKTLTKNEYENLYKQMTYTLKD